MSDNYRKDSKEYCRREEKPKPTSGAYIGALRRRPGEQGKIVASDRQLRAAPATGCPCNMEAELEPEAEEAWQGAVVGETAPAEPVMMEEEAVPVEAEAESELVVAGEVVPEIVEAEAGAATEPVIASETMERETPAARADESTGWFSWLRKSPRESGAEASEATVGEGGGVLPDGLPGGPWVESAVDPRVTEEEGGVMRLEAKLRAHDGSLKDASVTFKPPVRFYNWDGRLKMRKQSPPPEELYTGPPDDGLLSTDEISGEYSGCKPFNCCTSMTVVPLGANTIEIGHSTCLFFPCAAVMGPVAGGEVRTRKPGTNTFLHWRENGNEVTFSADGTIRPPREAECSQGKDWKKRPHSQKQTFREVSTKDLEGTWCVCSYCPFLPLWPLCGYCLCTGKTALDEDWYREWGCGCSLLPPFVILPNPALDKRPRIYVNGHPTNVFHSGDIHWSPDGAHAQMNYDIRYRDAGCGVAGCTCVKKLC